MQSVSNLWPFDPRLVAVSYALKLEGSAGASYLRERRLSSYLAVVEVTTTTMTDHDRLRPTVVKSSSRNINKQARSVVRKYRKQQNQLQMFKLKEIVPSLAKQKTLDEVSLGVSSALIH